MHGKRLLAALMISSGFLARQARSQTQQPAAETVVVPALPGQPNKEMRIGGKELANAETTGPEMSASGQVVQWEEGRSITVRFGDGVPRVVPVPSNIIFPPDLRPGGTVTILARQTADGRYRVTGLSTGARSAPLPPASAATPAAASGEVSSPPPVTETPAPSSPRGKKPGIRAAYASFHGTVVAYEEGKSITLKLRTGARRTFAIAKGAPVPEGITVGDRVVARVPSQKPADGKTTDLIGREVRKTTKIRSSLEKAESPTN